MGRGQERTFREPRGFGRHAARLFHHVDQQVDQQRRGDEVEHDRRDHDVAATLGLQISRDQRPGRAQSRRADDREGQRQRPMRPGDRQANQRHAEPAERRLPLAANVKHARLEGDGHGEAGEDEVCGVVKRVAPAIGRADGAVDHDRHRLERVLADIEHDEAGNDEREKQVDRGDQGHIGPGRHLVHQAPFRGAWPLVRRGRTAARQRPESPPAPRTAT